MASEEAKEVSVVALGFDVDFSSIKDHLNKIAYKKFKEYKVYTGILFNHNGKNEKSLRMEFSRMDPVYEGRVTKLYVTRHDDLIVAEISYCNDQACFLSILLNEKGVPRTNVLRDVKKHDKSYKVIPIHGSRVTCKTYLYVKEGEELKTIYKEKKVEE